MYAVERVNAPKKQAYNDKFNINHVVYSIFFVLFPSVVLQCRNMPITSKMPTAQPFLTFDIRKIGYQVVKEEF